MRKWVLPEYIDDILPPEAERIEHLRRRLLDHFRGYGYRLVQPPLVEHLDSLLTGTGRDLDLQTFKVVDQLSGRLLGLRADMTPQVARVDAHLLNETGVTRLCYAGSVLHTVPTGVTQSREVLQLGAELYGHAGFESDREVLELLLSALGSIDAGRLHLDLGHVGVYRALAYAGGADNGDDDELFAALRAKDTSRVDALTQGLGEPWRAALRALPTLYGPPAQVLARARAALPKDAAIGGALDTLEMLARVAAPLVQSLNLDLADLRGYHYHNGAIFAVLAPDAPAPIALGGRYDGIGKAFGRARPATGFTLYLRELAAVARDGAPVTPIAAPAGDDAALARAIAALRAAGEVVIVTLSGAATPPGARRLAHRDGRWAVVEPA